MQEKKKLISCLEMGLDTNKIFVYNGINGGTVNMSKTKEEISALKNEFETLNKKLQELSEEELKQIIGGIPGIMPRECPAEFCLYGSKNECPHINYGRSSIPGCKYN